MLHSQPERSRWFERLVFFVTSLVLVECLGAGYAFACRENAMIVFDASGSMARRRGGTTKIDIARRAATEVLPSLTRHRPTGLITYGGIDRPACRDVVVRVEPAAGSGSRIVSVLKHMPPLGPTALTLSVKTAAETLLQRGGNGVIVLITDGLENCGGSACLLASQLRQQSPGIKVHVISFYLEGEETASLKCLAAATKGTYVTANSFASLRDALRELLGCMRLSGMHRP